MKKITKTISCALAAVSMTAAFSASAQAYVSVYVNGEKLTGASAQELIASLKECMPWDELAEKFYIYCPPSNEGDNEAGGDADTGGDSEADGDADNGGDSEADSDVSTGGDSEVDGDVSTGGDSEAGGDVNIGGGESDGSGENSSGSNSSEQENKLGEEVLRLVNFHRALAGLPWLSLDASLSAVAQAHSEDMAKRNFFSHTNPDGLSPFDRMKNHGISYRTAAENIAAGQKTPEAVVNGWMNSSGHRANIMNGAFNKMGLGTAYGGSYGIYWTQCFTD